MSRLKQWISRFYTWLTKSSGDTITDLCEQYMEQELDKMYGKQE